MRPIRFIFALHNHQPVGNFGNVFEEAYQQSYLPFLDVFEGYASLKLTLHTSGSLIEWLAEEHPEYLDRLAVLVKQHRIEIVGGPFFEPILAMLPSRDRLGQIAMYSEYLKKRLGAEVTGLWIPERVWEQSYIRDLSDAGMQYTILDDSHLKFAGIRENKLYRHYLSEDDGRILNVFPGSEKLRYLIPFGRVEDAINYFRRVAETTDDDDAVLVHADDGEKFGSWPETYQHVYSEKWLHRFFDALCENSDWLRTTVPSEVLSSLEPLGKIYIPDGSYREMTEWSLEPEEQNQLEQLHKDLENDSRLQDFQPVIKKFLRGGFWRNFKVRYPESNEMYCRMMAVSARLNKAIGEGFDSPGIDLAKESLYRSQCNCGYWHGAFGGVYLPHLRNAVYRELIKADNLIDTATERKSPWIESQTADFNFDGKNEVRLTNDRLNVFLEPHHGGTLYELDIKAIEHNLLATLTRRPEAYHQKLLHRHAPDASEPERKIICKQEGLERRLQYDKYPRKSLIDLFYDYDADFDAVRFQGAGQHGDFLQSEYNAVIRKKPDRIQILLSREAEAYGAQIRIDKAVTLSEGSNVVEVAYRLSQLPPNYRMHFAVEMNFAGMPGGADNRYFYTADKEQLGNLSVPLDLTNSTDLALYDDWLGLDAKLSTNRPTDFYTFPIETVSQSVEGFELVHQSVAVLPHWRFTTDSSGVFDVALRLQLDTTVAEERELKAYDFLKDAARMLVGELV